MKKLIIAILALIPFSGFADDVKIPVETRKSHVKEFHVEKAVTVDGIEGFTGAEEPATDKFGGYLTADLKATGFFRTEKYDGRWWIVTPEGHPFIFKGVAGVNGSTSANYKKNRDRKFGGALQWAEKTIPYLKSLGFNAAGAWGSVDTFVQLESEKIPYCVIISPLKKFEHTIRKDFKDNRVVFVFDDGLEEAVAKALEAAKKYKDDPWCVGYFIDNEIPWKNSLLEYYLSELPEGDPNRTAAEKWLKKRKGRAKDAISIDDRERFAAYVFEHYQQIALKHLRRNDPNHMYLGCRFNVWPDELSNRYIFEAAGKYMDIISVNHYNHWEPYWKRFDRWEEWSGKPSMVTEFYTKGMDSGMENATGAGWVVHTQKERGIFYQNFVINLLKSPACVGWHWFKYCDNDPDNPKADPSNRNSNKGIVNVNFEPYEDLAAEMTKVNSRVYSIARHYQNAPRKGCACLIDDDFREEKVDRYKAILDSLEIRATFALVPKINPQKNDRVIEYQRQRIKNWQHEGFSVALHPSHSGWYTNKKGSNEYKGADVCEQKLLENIKVLKKSLAQNYENFLVYPGSSGTNPEVVKMAGKHVKYGIGGMGCAGIKNGPIQIERLFISPNKPAEEFKAAIKAAIEKDGYVILGTHSWQFDESNYGYLIDMLSYVKTLAEFQTLQETIPAWIGR